MPAWRCPRDATAWSPSTSRAPTPTWRGRCGRWSASTGKATSRRPSVADFRIVTEIFYDGAWHDISADVRNKDVVVVERGAPDESGSVRPAKSAFTLNNGRSNVGAGVIGRYSP